MPSNTSSALAEQARRLAALERSNRNLSALVSGAAIPVLLLDRNLRISDFSAPLVDLVPLDTTSRGSTLGAVEWPFAMDWLPRVAQQVLESGTAEEHAAEAAPPGARCDVRVLPWEGDVGPGIAVVFQPLGSDTGSGDCPRCRDAVAGMHAIRHQLANAGLLMRSVIRRSAETADSLENYVMHLEARVDSIDRTLSALVREPGKTFDLCELIDDELEEQGAYRGSKPPVIKGPRIAMRATAAQVLGLVFQELVTNAIQHGPMGSEHGGQLYVAWTVGEIGGKRQLHLNWIEKGAVDPPRRQGFGTTVLESMLSYQLDGRATRSFDESGLHITLTVPMSNLAATDIEPFGLS